MDTGKQILNLGGSQSIVINEGSQNEADPMTRFPIPNETEIKKQKRKRGEGSSTGDTVQGKKQPRKPFKAPRVQTVAVEQQQVLRRSPRGKNVISTIGSTTTS
ncbi:uncharacterized protein LOC131015635 [Salvia miltiorrhiza]|nr:uncharacterized protein LOC131015635 [Salvia miltiorrhiza]